jgi:hypothetical protein
LDTCKSFLSKLNLTPESDSLFRKNQMLRYPKPDSLVFAASTFGLNFFYLGSLIPFSHFPCLKTPWTFKSSSLAPFLVLP